MPEPGNPQSLNRYTYVRNRPLTYIDPSGHFEEEELAKLLGFASWKELAGSDLWKNWQEEWRTMLLSDVGQLGSWLMFSPSGKYWTASGMLAQREDNGQLVFWDVNHGVTDLKWLAANMPYFAVFTQDPNGHYGYLKEFSTYDPQTAVPETRSGGWADRRSLDGTYLVFEREWDYGLIGLDALATVSSITSFFIPIAKLPAWAAKAASAAAWAGRAATALEVSGNIINDGYVIGIKPTVIDVATYLYESPVDGCPSGYCIGP